MNAAPSIQFYPTLRCNADCRFCFNKGLPATDDVRIDDFRKMASMLKGAGIRYIDILGGEPTLHPDLIPLLDIVRAEGMKSNLSTNGTNVALLNILSERYGKEFLRIGISMNSREASADLHAYIATHRPVLKSVLTRKAAIPGSAEQYIGRDGIEYFLLYMDAVNERDLADSLPFPRYYRKLAALKNIYPNLDGVYCSGFISRPGDDPALRSVRCPAGTAKLSLTADGDLYPCYLFFRHKEFKLGNILTDNFATIRQSPILNYFRTFPGNKCPDADCPLFTSCHGGCPAISYIFHRDCDAPDPRCAKTVNYSRRELPRKMR